jgi:hypothetical protein
MIPADETFEDTWPFAPHFSESAGFRKHYAALPGLYWN